MPNEQRIISFSGGKDSTCLLLMMIEKHIPFDRIIFVDTTKEFPDMIKHIEQVKEYIYPLKIETVKIDFDYWFSEHVKTKGKHQGKKGYGFPDFRIRWCTALKREAFDCSCFAIPYNPKKRGGATKKERKGIKIIQFHGIAYDENKRCKKNIEYPLVDWKITEKQALEYCYSKGFNWNGLYEKFQRVSCWCCPFSRMGELKTLYNEFPELWKQLKQMEAKSFRKFRYNYSVQELEDRFNYENKSLFNI